MKTPVYVSLTSIFKNQSKLLKTLVSITKQTYSPNKIFLYLSETPYILDSGFKKKKITNTKLSKFLKKKEKKIEVKWVKNQGSYRKLIPILRKRWNEDCIIITIDDDTIYHNKLIENMINDYNEHKCVVSYRGFTPDFVQKGGKICDFDYEKKDELIHKNIYNFVTGKGGILYKPVFFHKTGDLIFNKNFYTNICKKQDDLWFYILRIINNIECFIDTKEYMIKDNSGNGLHKLFNSVENNNTLVFQNLVKTLHENNFLEL